MSSENESPKALAPEPASKPNFFQRMFVKLDEKMKEKAEASASCDCGCGDDDKGSKKQSDKCC